MVQRKQIKRFVPRTATTTRQQAVVTRAPQATQPSVTVPQTQTEKSTQESLRKKEQEVKNKLKVAEQREIEALNKANATQPGTEARRLAVFQLDRAKAERKSVQRELRQAKDIRKASEGKISVQKQRNIAAVKKQIRKEAAKTQSDLKNKSKQLETLARQQAKAYDEFNANIRAVQEGRTTPGLLLKQGKISAKTATALVQAKELSVGELEKLRTADISKAIAKLQKPNIVTDTTTSIQLFKTSVNRALASQLEQPIPLDASVETFDKAREVLEKKISENKTNLQKARIKATTQKLNLGKKLNLFKGITGDLNLTKNEQSILENKFLTGQTVTPLEKQAFANIKNLENKKLLKKQKDIAKSIITSPVNYGKNLVLRFKNGENNPLFNDIKNFGKGITFGLKEVFIDPIVGAFNYGKNLVKRAVKNNTSAQKIFKKDIKKLVKGISSTSKFVKENPVGAGIIVGAAVGQGLDVTQSEFKKNPAFTLGRAIAWFAPEKIVAIGGKAVRAEKLIDKFNAEKFTKNVYQLKQDLTTGKFTVKGDLNGVLIGNRPFKGKYILSYNPKTKIVQGKVTTQVKKEKTTQVLKFKDEGAFYKDLKTGEKYSKQKLPITEKKIKIKETEISPTQKNTIIQDNKILEKQGATVKTILTSIVNASKKVTTRTANVLKVVNPKTKKIIVGFSKQLSKNIKKGRLAPGKKVDPVMEKKLESFLKSIDYDKELLGGIDKRTRLARALGLRKDSKLIKTLETVIDKNGKLKFIFRKAEAKLKGVIEVGEKPPIKRKLFTAKFNLKKNKKGTFNVTKDSRIETLTKNKKGNYVKDYIELPPLLYKIPTGKVRLKGLGIYLLAQRLKQNLKAISKLQNKLTAKSIKQIQEKAKVIKQDIKKINVKVQKKVPVAKKKVVTKKVTKVKRIKRRVPKVRVPKVRIPKKPRLPKKPMLPSLDFNSSAYKDKIVLYEGIYRERRNRNKPYNKRTNPVVTKRIKLKTTRNRAINKVAQLADSRLVRSIKIKVVGVTNIKKKDIDVNARLKKFTRKKSKGTPVLDVVEKSKYIADTKTEVRELKVSKRRKKPSVKKKIKKTTKKKAKIKKAVKSKSKTKKKVSKKGSKKVSGSKRKTKKK